MRHSSSWSRPARETFLLAMRLANFPEYDLLVEILREQIARDLATVQVRHVLAAMYRLYRRG